MQRAVKSLFGGLFPSHHMGRYVQFARGTPDGLPGVIVQHLPGFVTWYRDTLCRDFAEDCCPQLLELAEELQSAGPRPVSTAAEAALVDALVSEIVGNYLDLAEGAQLSDVDGPLRYARRYERIEPWVQQNLGKLGGDAWAHILRGRGIWRSSPLPFISDDAWFYVGFLSLDECLALVPQLEKCPRCREEPECFEYFKRAVLECAGEGLGLVSTLG